MTDTVYISSPGQAPYVVTVPTGTTLPAVPVTTLTTANGGANVLATKSDGTAVPVVRQLTRTAWMASTFVPAAGTLVSDGVSVYAADGVTPERALGTGYLMAAAPKGSGLSDGDDLVTLANFAKTIGKNGVQLQPGTYRLLDKGYEFPGGVSLVGPGDDLCLIQMNFGAYMRFGAVAGPTASRFSSIAGFRIAGGGVEGDNTKGAVTPLRLGYNTASRVEDIRVANAAAGGPAVLSQLGQNTFWSNLEISQNLGDGLTLDMGMANHAFFGCIVRDNKGAGLTFDQSADPPTSTTAAGAPRNIHWYGGLIESNDGPNIYAKAWGQIDFVGAQVSHSAGVLSPSIYLSDEMSVGTPGSNINWIGGQLKAGSADGVAVRIMRGTFNVSGGTAINNALWAFELGTKGRLHLDQFSLNYGTLYRGVVLADNTPTAAVSGTFDARSLVTRHGRVTVGPTTDFSTVTTTLAPVTGMSVPLLAGREYKIIVDLEQTGDPGTNGDLKLAWDFPAGSGWTVRYKTLGLPTASTTSTGQVTRDVATQGTSTLVGTIAAVTSVEMVAYVFTGTVDGSLTLQAAQRAASTTATVINANSRLMVDRT